LKLSWSIDWVWIYKRKTYKIDFDENCRKDSDQAQHSSSYFDYYHRQRIQKYHLFFDFDQESEHDNELCECNFEEKERRNRWDEW
jgi:hypothetical protein